MWLLRVLLMLVMLGGLEGEELLLEEGDAAQDGLGAVDGQEGELELAVEELAGGADERPEEGGRGLQDGEAEAAALDGGLQHQVQLLGAAAQVRRDGGHLLWGQPQLVAPQVLRGERQRERLQRRERLQHPAGLRAGGRPQQPRPLGGRERLGDVAGRGGRRREGQGIDALQEGRLLRLEGVGFEQRGLERWGSMAGMPDVLMGVKKRGC